MFKTVFVELLGRCNAKCHWCQTGLSNKEGKPHGRLMPVREFAEAIEYLQKNSFLGESSEVHLYNWAEPFLHPQFKDIVKILIDKKIKWGISTNASVLPDIYEDLDYSTLSSVVYSSCGYTQESYSRIHGFNAEKVRRNIETITKKFRTLGCKANIILHFHVYQFNIAELIPMHRFCDDNKIALMATYATINDWERAMQYCKGELPYAELERASRELFLSVLEKGAKEPKPENYRCSQMNYLNIDQDCDIITCCGESTKLGRLFEMSVQDVERMRLASKVCADCLKYKVDWTFTRDRSVKPLLDLLYASVGSQAVVNNLPSDASVSSIIRSMWSSLSVKKCRVAVCGAGKHTLWLSQMVKGLESPEVVAVLDDGGAMRPQYFGCTPMAMEEFSPANVDAILISSDSPEIIAKMSARCRSLYGESVKLLLPYRDLPPGPYNKSSIDHIYDEEGR